MRLVNKWFLARHRSILSALLLLSACTTSARQTIEPVIEPTVGPEKGLMAKATFDSTWSIVARTHWDSTLNGADWNKLRDSLRPLALAANSRNELRAVLSQLLSSLRQSHFAILPKPSDSTLDAPTVESAGHIGITSRWIDNQAVVVHVQTGSSASTLGVRPGWVIVAVGKDTIAKIVNALANKSDSIRTALSAYSITDRLLTGKADEQVKILFKTESEKDSALTIKRSPIQGTPVRLGNLPSQWANLEWKRVISQGKKIGIIKFNMWMPVLAREFDIAIDSLRDSDAIVLDIRGNFGGVAGMAMGIAGHFVDTAVPIGVMKRRNGELRFTINPRRVNTSNQRVSPFSGPLAILIDELTVSTSEIFAGGLQELGRAVVVGRQTSGQALPAVAESLPNGDILYHAIADFRSPSGRSLEGAGVVPDVSVVTRRNDLLQKRDPALESAFSQLIDRINNGTIGTSVPQIP